MPVIDVKPATTLEEVASQIEEAMSYSVEHYTRVCDVVLGQWLMVCRSIDVDALLALADEMGRVRSRCRYCNKESDCDWADETVCLESYIDDFASRIREALGARDG